MCWSLEQGRKSSAASLCIERAENELRKHQDPPITEPASNPSIIMGPSRSLIGIARFVISFSPFTFLIHEISRSLMDPLKCAGPYI